MCGKFTFYPSPEMLDALPEAQHNDFMRGDIIVPGMPILLYRASGLDVAHWSFKANWNNDDDFKASSHNARSESVADKPLFRDAWGAGQRCIIPVSTFFEWDHEKNGSEISPDNQDFIFLAGIWNEVWHQNEDRDAPIITTAILTKPSQEPMSNLRSRMPVILKRNHLTQWIKGSYIDAQSLIQSADASDIALTPVPKKPAAQGSLL